MVAVVLDPGLVVKRGAVDTPGASRRRATRDRRFRWVAQLGAALV